MRQYEVAFIVHPEVDEDGVSALTEKVQGWITASGGTVEKVERLGKKGSAKGMVVTGGDVKKHARLFRAYSLVYPFVASVAALDTLIPWVSGYMLIASAERLNRATVSHGFPTADIDQMLAEIERGYLEMPR